MNDIFFECLTPMHYVLQLTIIFMGLTVSFLIALKCRNMHWILPFMGLAIYIASLFLLWSLFKTNDFSHPEVKEHIWLEAVKNNIVPDVALTSITDEWLDNRYTVSLTNNEIYHIPYENISSNKRKVSLSDIVKCCEDELYIINQ